MEVERARLQAVEHLKHETETLGRAVQVRDVAEQTLVKRNSGEPGISWTSRDGAWRLGSCLRRVPPLRRGRG